MIRNHDIDTKTPDTQVHPSFDQAIGHLGGMLRRTLAKASIGVACLGGGLAAAAYDSINTSEAPAAASTNPYAMPNGFAAAHGFEVFIEEYASADQDITTNLSSPANYYGRSKLNLISDSISDTNMDFNGKCGKNPQDPSGRDDYLGFKTDTSILCYRFNKSGYPTDLPGPTKVSAKAFNVFPNFDTGTEAAGQKAENQARIPLDEQSTPTYVHASSSDVIADYSPDPGHIRSITLNAKGALSSDTFYKTSA
jgi:hypothetical protein